MIPQVVDIQTEIVWCCQREGRGWIVIFQWRNNTLLLSVVGCDVESTRTINGRNLKIEGRKQQQSGNGVWNERNPLVYRCIRVQLGEWSAIKGLPNIKADEKVSSLCDGNAFLI